MPKPLQAPLSFVQVSGREVPVGASKCNPQEAEAVQKLVHKILHGRQVSIWKWSRQCTTQDDLIHFHERPAHVIFVIHVPQQGDLRIVQSTD